MASATPGLFRFQQALNRPAETQQKLLQRLLRQNSLCAYGRKYNFASIQTPEDFARLVPVVGYDELEPWIEKIVRGEKQVLTTEAVTHLIPTSGSTSARKLIPFTKSLQRDFNAAIHPWIADLFRQKPSLGLGPAYWSISPALNNENQMPSSVPIGFEADTSYLGGAGKWLVDAVMAVPSSLRQIKDLPQFRYLTLLHLLRQRELRLISIWHPSFLALLLDDLPALWEKLLRDIGDGRRTRELCLADPQHPQTLWPNLAVISCWGDGPAKLAMTDLQRRFPNVQFQPKGLLATEAFVTIPFADGHPLAVCSHYFEFIDGQGRILPAHDLRENETYEVIVTTFGGLWRYRLGDSVQVTGFIEKTPSLKFLGRTENVSDLFGEKLSESFVAAAISALPIPLPFALLAPDQGGYTLYAEGPVPPDLAATLDQFLRQNPHYAYCRDLGQLSSVRVFVIAERGYEQFARHETATGKRLGDIKPAILSKSTCWSNVFAGTYLS